MPYVVGLPVAEAVAQLEAAGYNPTHPAVVCPGGEAIVNSQTPATGAVLGDGISLGVECSGGYYDPDS